MEQIFLRLLHMGLAAGWLILAVLALRALMKKRVPKWQICILWGIVAVRLVCPYSPKSAFSLMPREEALRLPAVRHGQESGVLTADQAHPVPGARSLPAPGTSVNPARTWMFWGGILWAVGVALLLLYALASVLRLHRRLREAVALEENIRLCDAVDTPFILGVLRPRIYLPSGLLEEERVYVIAHERAHLKRGDHWWKFLGYLLLTVYWFHPLVWAAYGLFCRDIELACDEKAVKNMSMEEKKAYSHTLVSCSTEKRMLPACPLAFGESGVKERVKAVLNGRKPAVWVSLAALAVCAVTAVCFLTNPREDGPDGALTAAVSIPQELRDQKQDEPPAEETSLDTAVREAVLEKNAGLYAGENNFVCCDFFPLETESVPSGKGTDMVTCYGWALYQQYRISEEGIEDMGGSHIPAALTFEKAEDGYVLKEYWEPRDGSYFEPDIRSKFPKHIAEDGIDSQKFILRQIQSCYRQAVESGGFDTAAVIGSLLKEVCSGPKTSSNPQDYIEEHALEYRELTYYGISTLRYCFERFDEGGETGLEGRIMALVCEEILQNKGSLPEEARTAQTGQLWFDTLRAHADNVYSDVMGQLP